VLGNAGSLADGRVIARGGTQFWHTLRWNGFRPRAAVLDQPVRFRTSAPRDSSDTTRSDTTRSDTTRASADGSLAPPRADSAAPGLFTVSFAAVQNERTARDLVTRIKVGGQSPRITTADRNGTILFRVVMGPYTSRAEAERVGKASGQSYWIFEGAP
jgi:cell division septation protein DedD